VRLRKQYPVDDAARPAEGSFGLSEAGRCCAEEPMNGYPAMPGSRAAKPPKSFSLGEIAGLVGAKLKGDPDIRIHGLGALEDARPDQLSFLIDARYEAALAGCRAAALIVSPSFEHIGLPLLISDKPYLCLARAAQLFVQPPALQAGIHSKACVEADADIGEDVGIGPLALIGSGTTIGRGTCIHGSVHLGRDVVVGEDCVVHPGVVILDGCRIGNRVIIHSGTVIGSDGFGFAQDEEGRHVKIPQAGIVQIDDDVEIGANCTIDRATFGRTWIKCGTKIDNLVQIAHNVTVGEHSILVAQVGISGSTRLGKHVVLAGQVGIAGHVEIGDRVRIAAKSGVAHSVEADQDIVGLPAVPHREWFRMYGNIQRLGRFKEELRRLKEKVQQLERKWNKE